MADLAALRESLRKLAPGAVPLTDDRRGALGSGFAALDGALSWAGFPRGAVSELCGAASSGKTAVALTAIAAHTAAGGLAVWIDGTGQLFPPTAAALGVALDRLLVVRPAADLPPDALAAAAAQAGEIVARSGAFAVIAIDLPAGVRLIRSPAARLRGAMQRSGATALVIGADRGGPVFDGALARLRLRRQPGGVAATIDKGGRGGAGAVVELRLGRARLDGQPGAPVAPVTTRLAPGVEVA
jgi:hypothetical protein